MHATRQDDGSLLAVIHDELEKTLIETFEGWVNVVELFLVLVEEFGHLIAGNLNECLGILARKLPGLQDKLEDRSIHFAPFLAHIRRNLVH